MNSLYLTANDHETIPEGEVIHLAQQHFHIARLISSPLKEQDLPGHAAGLQSGQPHTYSSVRYNGAHAGSSVLQNLGLSIQ